MTAFEANPSYHTRVPLTTGGRNRLSRYKTSAHRSPTGDIVVAYQSTQIVCTYTDDSIPYVQLNTGGYETVTTKRKMNQAANQFDLGFSIYQRKHKWYVTTKAGDFAYGDDSLFIFDRDTGIPLSISSLFTN